MILDPLSNEGMVFLFTRGVAESLRDDKRMILRCDGTREKNHYKSKGKLFGIIPFAHCDTDCPYIEDTCIRCCSHLQMRQRQCLRAVYGENRRIKIANKIEAKIIIKGIEDLVKKGQILTDKQKYDYEFAKVFLNDIKKRRVKLNG